MGINLAQVAKRAELLRENLLVSPRGCHKLGHFSLKLSQLTGHLSVDRLVPELHLGKNLQSKHHKSCLGVVWEFCGGKGVVRDKDPGNPKVVTHLSIGGNGGGNLLALLLENGLPTYLISWKVPWAMS